jgi:acyl carrier protein
MDSAITEDEIKTWLISYLADILDMPSEEVDPNASFDEFGLDSALAISLTGDLEEWLGKKVNPTLLYNYTTISSLSKNLAAEVLSS